MRGKKRGFVREGIAQVRIECAEARTQRAQTRGRMARHINYHASAFMRTELIECQLYRGGDKYPRAEKITMSCMGRRNRKLEDSFMADTNPGARLWQWRIIDYPAYEKKKLEAAAIHAQSTAKEPVE